MQDEDNEEEDGGYKFVHGELSYELGWLDLCDLPTFGKMEADDAAAVVYGEHGESEVE